MTLNEAIFARSQADAPLVAIVGTKVFYLNAAQGTVGDYIIFQGIGSDPDVSHAGASGAVLRAVQFACFASTSARASALRAALIAAFDGVELGNGDIGTLQDDGRDDYDDVTRLFRADADFIF